MTHYNQYKKKFSRDEALVKAQKFCAYQERCVHDMEVKLRDWGLNQKDVDLVIDELVETNFIDEKRFTDAFVRGKFMNKRWGRFKIRMALKEKRVREEIIEKALTKLDEKEYVKTAKHLIDRKMSQSTESDDRKKRSKVYYYMLSKGYEPNVVIDVLGSMGG